MKGFSSLPPPAIIPIVALQRALRVLIFFEGSCTTTWLPILLRTLAKVPEALTYLPPSPEVCSML